VGDASQEKIAQATGELAADLARGGEELLGEEGVPLRAGHDLVRHGRRQRSLAVSREERRQLVALERAEIEDERRAGASDSVGKPSHALTRGGLVCAVGREHENRPVVEVVREEDDEVEGRDIGPVQILEHEQHRCGGCPVGEQRERVLEYAQLRVRLVPVGVLRLAQRTQGLDEWLVRQVCADKIDRAPEEDIEPCVAGALSDFGREPGLPDPGFAG
jgi:hypothetical protein